MKETNIFMKKRKYDLGHLTTLILANALDGLNAKILDTNGVVREVRSKARLLEERAKDAEACLEEYVAIRNVVVRELETREEESREKDKCNAANNTRCARGKKKR
jgi:rRNA-processing protein FCF1